MSLDEDKDVELTFSMEPELYRLHHPFSEIPEPGKNKDYDLQCTVYYGVTQEQAVDDYLKQEVLDEQIPFYATTNGMLDEESNLRAVLKTIPLPPALKKEASAVSRL
ncbi:MAG: hypothetical protein K0S08_2111 [Gammaproteobacteria bacterium]|jgi:hypothetical protein|nr:hypothetical protein [Gammaproteobacteria bacterium]